MATDSPSYNPIERGVWRATALIGLLLFLYPATYGYFKTQCGLHFVARDPWIGGDSSTSMSFSGYWGTMDMASGKMTEQFRPVAHPFSPKWAKFLDALFYPAKQFDQYITGWQISFEGRPF